MVGFFTGEGTSSETFLITFSNKDSKFNPPWDSVFFGKLPLLWLGTEGPWDSDINVCLNEGYSLVLTCWI